MINVLIDLTSLDDNFSGIEHYALYITKELIKNDNRFFHLVFKNKVSYLSEEEIKKDNIKVHIIEGKRFNVLLFGLPKLIKSIKPDYALFLAFPPSFLYKPNKDTKVIGTIHDIVAFDMPETMAYKSRVFFKLSLKHLLKISTNIATVSEFSKQRIIDKFKYDESKIVISYDSYAMVEKLKKRDEIAGKYSLPDHYLLSLSTVEPRKNFANLIKWLDDAWEKDSSLPDLVIAGRSGWKNEKILENIKHLEKVHFTGFIDDEDIYSVYHHADVFLFPSLYEGFGIPLLESVIARRLPICSNIPTSIEILGKDYPFLFKNNDGNEFVLTLNNYLNTDEKEKDELLTKLTNKVKVFNWKDSARNIDNCFIEVK